MSSTPHPPFSYLRRKIKEWKDGDLFQPGEQNWQQFRHIAPVQLAPIVTALQEALQTEGFRATIHDMSDERRQLSLLIEPFDIAITFGPHKHPHLIRLHAYRRANPEDECKELIAYRDLDVDLDRVMAIIEDVTLRILGPRRANKEPERS